MVPSVMQCGSVQCTDGRDAFRDQFIDLLPESLKWIARNCWKVLFCSI